MLRSFARSWALYWRLISIQLRSQMQYRASFWLELISTGVLNGAYFLSIALVFQRFPTIGGWSLGEVAFLMGLMEMSFALMDLIFSGFDDRFFSQMVRTGAFDQLLLRPVGIFCQVLGSQFNLRRIGRFLEGVVIFTIALNLVDVHWTVAKLAYLPVVLASQVLAMGGLFVLGAVLTFWTVGQVEAINILTYGGVEMMSYPMTVYPKGLVRFFTYVIPFIFLNYYPALFFLDKPDPFGLPVFAPFLAPLAAVGMFAVALAGWNKGAQYYQSTGS